MRRHRRPGLPMSRGQEYVPGRQLRRRSVMPALIRVTRARFARKRAGLYAWLEDISFRTGMAVLSGAFVLVGGVATGVVMAVPGGSPRGALAAASQASPAAGHQAGRHAHPGGFAGGKPLVQLTLSPDPALRGQTVTYAATIG